jgi:ParB/RepB/Spo0J family partition protein
LFTLRGVLVKRFCVILLERFAVKQQDNSVSERSVNEESRDYGSVQELRLSDIVASPHQPRKRMIRKTDVEELMASLQAVGQLQPIIASPADEAGKYHVHAGHRRCAALRFLGHQTVRAFVRIIDAREARKLALSENLGREDLSAIEQADALSDYAKEYALSFAAAAAELGISESTRKRLASIVTASQELRDVLTEHSISARAAVLLVRLDKERPGIGVRRAKAYAEGRMSLAKLESEIAALKVAKGSKTRRRNVVECELSRSRIDLRVSLNTVDATAEEIEQAVHAMRASLGALGFDEPRALFHGGSGGT